MLNFLKMTNKKLILILLSILFVFEIPISLAGKNQKGGGDSGKSGTVGKKQAKKSNSNCGSSSSGKNVSSNPDCDASISPDSISSSVFLWGSPYVSPQTSTNSILGGSSFNVAFNPGTTTIVTNASGINLSITSSFTTEGASLITSTPENISSSTALVNFNNLQSITLSIGIDQNISTMSESATNLSSQDNKVIVSKINADSEKGVFSSGVILTISPTVVENIQNAIANSPNLLLVDSLSSDLVSENASLNLNNSIEILLNSENLPMVDAQTLLPTALNDALNSISEIKTNFNKDDNSNLAKLARALNSIKINSIPGLKNPN